MPQDYENCETARELLKKVNAELAWFAVKNLPDLQKELQDFVNAQDGLISDYASKFPDLRKKWCARQVDVERLCAHIRCEFPLKEEKWRRLIEKCICKPMHDLCCLGQQIARRNYCCAGPFERKRNEAQWAFNKAQAHLAWTKTLAKSLDDQLAVNLDLVNQINAVTPDQRPVVLYLFYQLRRSHVHMAPFDASPECKEVCAEFDPDKLCCEVFKHPCPDEDCNCTPKGEWPHHDCSHAPKLDAPWLMSPDKYRNALDCAWDEYHKAKEALAKAEAELKKHPDDLKSLQDKYDAETKGLKDCITNCLKREKPPTDDCCRENEPRKGGY